MNMTQGQAAEEEWDSGEVLLEANDDGDDVAEEQAEEPEVPAPVDDPFAELEGLLTESLEIRKAKTEGKETRERLRRGGQGHREMLEDQARLREWESKHEWKAEANAALFERQVCGCGSHREMFVGLLRRDVHRHMRTAQRWVAVGVALADLPNETVFRVKDVALCWVCAESKGWVMANATEWKGW